MAGLVTRVRLSAAYPTMLSSDGTAMPEVARGEQHADGEQVVHGTDRGRAVFPRQQGEAGAAAGLDLAPVVGLLAHRVLDDVIRRQDAAPSRDRLAQAGQLARSQDRHAGVRREAEMPVAERPEMVDDLAEAGLVVEGDDVLGDHVVGGQQQRCPRAGALDRR